MPKKDAARAPRSKPKPSSPPELLLAFLNVPDLDSPRKLADWLEQRSLVAPGTKLDESDLERTVKAREAARTLLARGPAATVDAAAARLDQMTSAATIRTRFGAGGRIRLEPATGGLDGALARVCGLLAAAQLDGTWQRLKICWARDCGAVFFDDSRNHSRRWCSTRCCSRTTSLAYRRSNLETVRERDRFGAFRRRYEF